MRLTHEQLTKLEAAIAAKRADKEFQALVQQLIRENRGALDRLARS